MASEAITRNDLTAILDKTLPSAYKCVDTLIFNQSYTTGTAGSWVKSIASVVIPKTGLYRMRAGHNNSAVYGLGYSSTSVTNIVASIIVKENPTASSIEVVQWLPASTYSIWTKCATASKSNSIMIWKIDVVREE